MVLHVEYAERGIVYRILFILSLFYECIHLEYVRIHVIYKVNKAEYVIHVRVNPRTSRSPQTTTRRL